MTHLPPEKTEGSRESSPFVLVSLYLLPLLLYAVLIFYLSSRPPPDVLPKFHHADKVGHFLEYGGLGFLMARFLRAFRGRRDNLLFSISSCLGYALLDEVHQAFVVSRTFSLFDLGADLAGALFGAATYMKLYALARAFPWKLGKKKS